MGHVVAVYTTLGLVDPLRAIFAAELPGERLTNLVDDSLIRDVVAAGAVTPAVEARLLQYYGIARGMGADVILNTCSSVGDVASAAQSRFEVPIVRIDEPMARQAVTMGRRIAVLATLPTTLDPTVRLLRRVAGPGAGELVITESLAGGAYDALMAGRPREHDRLLEEAACAVAGTIDVLVLAQGSMARVAGRLGELAGVPVLSSLAGGVAEVKLRLHPDGKTA